MEDIKKENCEYHEESKHRIFIKCPFNYTETKYHENFYDSTAVSELIKQEDFKCIDPDIYLDVKKEDLDIKDENVKLNFIAEDPCKTDDESADVKIDLVTETPERKCSECHFQTNSKYKLLAHRKHSHPEILPYKCTKCDFFTRKKVSMTQHMMSHLGEKPYKCDNCDFRTSKQYLLNRHLKFHTEKNLYHCESCSFKTNQKSTLLQHIRSHTGERPFNCDFCEYTGRTAHQMKVHIMRKHSGNSPYLCNVCGLKIGDKTKLTVHMRTHSGEKPYECDLCGYKLTQKSSLVRHKKIHTMMKTNPRKRSKYTTENLCWPNGITSFNIEMKRLKMDCFNKEMNCFNNDIKPFKTEVLPFNPPMGAFNPADPLNVYEDNRAANIFAMNMQLWRNSIYDMSISKYLEDNTVKVKEEAEFV